MATSSTYNTVLAIILSWIDGDISLKGIQEIVDTFLDNGEAWVENGQLITSQYEDRHVGNVAINKMIDSCKEDIERLKKELENYKEQYYDIAAIRNKESSQTIKEKALKCILANVCVRTSIAKQIARLQKKRIFLEDEISSYTHQLSKKLKFLF